VEAIRRIGLYLKIANFGPVRKEVELYFEIAEGVEDNDYEVKMPGGRKLLKLAYIYGANASGKTTILMAFDFLRKLWLQPIEDKAGELDFEPFLFCDKPYSNPSHIELAFYVDVSVMSTKSISPKNLSSTRKC
jgi:AAA15 family ATPase/GTPase